MTPRLLFEARARALGHTNFYRYKKDGINNGRIGQYCDTTLEFAWQIWSAT